MSESKANPDPLVAPVVGGTPEQLRWEAAAARSAATFVTQYVKECCRHTEAVSECPHCNLNFLASYVARAADYFDAALVPRPEPREPEPELLAVLKDVLAQFDAGMFVRNTDSDGCSDWAIKAAKPLLVLARAKAAVDKADAALRPASAPSQWTCPYCGHVEEKNHENWQRCAADHIDHCPVVVGAASAPSLEQERLGPPFNCHHEFNITAWHRHERVGTHCHKCGAFRPKEFEVAASGR